MVEWPRLGVELESLWHSLSFWGCKKGKNETTPLWTWLPKGVFGFWKSGRGYPLSKSGLFRSLYNIRLCTPPTYSRVQKRSLDDTITLSSDSEPENSPRKKAPKIESDDESVYVPLELKSSFDLPDSPPKDKFTIDKSLDKTPPRASRPPTNLDSLDDDKENVTRCVDISSYAPVKKPRKRKPLREHSKRPVRLNFESPPPSERSWKTPSPDPNEVIGRDELIRLLERVERLDF